MCKLEEKIFEMLKEVARRLFAIRKEVQTCFNLTSGEYSAVCVLSKEKEVNQSTLSLLCGIDKPATSRLINKMQKENLINKTLKKGNNKSIFIYLSEKGKCLAKQINQKIKEVKVKYFSNLDEHEKQIFLEMLSRKLKKEENNA